MSADELHLYVAEYRPQGDLLQVEGERDLVHGGGIFGAKKAVKSKQLDDGEGDGTMGLGYHVWRAVYAATVQALFH